MKQTKNTQSITDYSCKLDGLAKHINLKTLTRFTSTILIALSCCYTTNLFAASINLEHYAGGYNANLAGKPAITFKFTAKDRNHYCNIITTEEHMFKSNNLLENINLSDKNFYLDCEVNGQFYILSNRYRTYAQVLIKQPDINFPMSMHIEAKLVTIDGNVLNVSSGDISLKR